MPIKAGNRITSSDVNLADGLPLTLFLSDKYGIDYSSYVLYDSTGADYADPSSTADWETGYKVRPGFNYFDRIDDASLDTSKWDTYTSGYASISETGSGLEGGYIESWTGQNNGAGTAHFTSKTGGLFNTSNRIDFYLGTANENYYHSKIQITDGTNTVDVYFLNIGDLSASPMPTYWNYFTLVYDNNSDTVTLYKNYDWSNPVSSNIDISSITGTREIRFYNEATNAADGYLKLSWLSLEKKTTSELLTSTIAPMGQVKGFFLVSSQSGEDTSHTIDWYYSVDGGTNWNSFTPRSVIWFDYEQSTVKFKAVFTVPSDDLTVGPRLTKYAVSWLR